MGTTASNEGVNARTVGELALDLDASQMSDAATASLERLKARLRLPQPELMRKTLANAMAMHAMSIPQGYLRGIEWAHIEEVEHYCYSIEAMIGLPRAITEGVILGLWLHGTRQPYQYTMADAAHDAYTFASRGHLDRLVPK